MSTEGAPTADLSVPQPTSRPKRLLSRREEEIIMHTALRTRDNAQLEVLLKVRMDENPDFDFLYPGNDQHAHYIFVKSLPTADFWNLFLGKGKEIPELDREETQGHKDALSLLEELYGDMDQPMPTDDGVESAQARIKAERLHRAKLLFGQQVRGREVQEPEQEESLNKKRMHIEEEHDQPPLKQKIRAALEVLIDRESPVV